MTAAPDPTAVRVALWRALHLEIDPPPHVLHDDIGLRLAAPEEGWRERPDMDADFTKKMRASIVARARFVEDFVEQQPPDQYVILGAGLDTFAQRKPEIAAQMSIVEVDRRGPQAWKKQRLVELGFGIPDWLRFVAVDFEAGESWLAKVDPSQRSVISMLGVSMYLTRDAIEATLRDVASFARGSTLVMSFLRPLDLVEADDRPMFEIALRGARASGTPFVSFFPPSQIVALARQTGFREAEHISAETLTDRYFKGRTDDLRPSSGEELIVART